jgi:hypothetical protein
VTGPYVAGNSAVRSDDTLDARVNTISCLPGPSPAARTAATSSASTSGPSSPGISRARQPLAVRHRGYAPQRELGYTCNKGAGPNTQRLYLNGTCVAPMSDTLPIDLNSAALGIGRHVSGIADPFDGLIDEFRISHVQRSDGWIETTWTT